MRIGAIGRLVAAGVVVTSLVGCFEEKDAITVYPDGSGKVQIHQRLGKEISNLVLLFAEDEATKKEAIETNLHKELAKWDGVVAWTDVKAELKDERVILDATGWFEDVTKVGKVSSDSVEKISWTKTADGFTFEWTDDREQNEEEKDPLEGDTVPKNDQLPQIMQSLKDLRIERQVTMPGPVTEAVGAKEKKDRSASSIVVGKELVTDVTELMRVADQYRKKIAAKEITKDKANEDLRARLKKLKTESSGDLKVTCKAADVAAEQAEHHKALDAAKKTWDASDVKKKVDEARASERAEKKGKPKKDDEHGMPDMPMPGGK
jgi:hypothetical protein